MRLEKALTKEEAIAISNNKNIGSIDFASYDSFKPDAKTLTLVNDYILKKRPDICVRIFAYTDISFISLLTDTCMLQWEADDLSNYAPLLKIKAIRWLRITNEKKGPVISLSWIKQFKDSLQILYVGGNFTDFETIGTLEHLTQLHLSSIKLKNADVIGSISSLQKLTFFHSSIKDSSSLDKLQLLEFSNTGSQQKDFDFLGRQKSLKYFHLSLSNIENIDFILQITDLRILELSWLTAITALPALDQLKKLQKIEIDLCNKLKDIKPLKKLNNCQVNVYNCKLIADYSVSI